MGSFSKSISPSLRVGFIAAPGVDRCLIEHLCEAKSSLSLHTSQVCQAIVGGVLHDCSYSLRRRCREGTLLYKRKRDELARALQEAAACSAAMRPVRWSTPAGGFFMPVDLPRPFLRGDLVELRDAFGVLVTPMSEFSVSGACANSIRSGFQCLAFGEDPARCRSLGSISVTRSMTMSGILDLIGNTPLVDFATVNRSAVRILHKLEKFNAGGSIKDRPARFIIDQAVREGRLRPGGTIIGSSSGNFGISLAMIGSIPEPVRRSDRCAARSWRETDSTPRGGSRRPRRCRSVARCRSASSRGT